MSFDYISHGVPTVPTPVAPAFLVDISAGVLYTNPTNQGTWVAVGSGIPTSLTGIADVIPPVQGSVIITGNASADLMTLAAPAASATGARLTITSNSAFAHTITATSLLNDGTTGSPHTTATFAAFPGASIQLEAVAGKWNVISLQHVTIS